MSLGLLTETQENQVNNCFKDIVNRIVDKTKEHKGALYSVIHMNELAQETGLSYRTILRQVQEIENLGLGKLVTKRGPKGGAIVMFNQDRMHKIKPEFKNNPFVEGSPKANEIKEMELPSYQPKRLGLRRSKEEMDKIRMEQHAENERMAAVNDKLEKSFYPTREMFSEAYPDLPVDIPMRAYLISKAYAIYVRHYSCVALARAENMKDPDKIKKATLFAEKNSSYDTFPDRRWLGTRRFEDFIRCIEMCDARGYNPLVIMTKQFENRLVPFTMYGYEFKGPWTNMLYSQKAINQMEDDFKYRESKKHGVENRNHYLRYAPLEAAFPKALGGTDPLIREIDHALKILSNPEGEHSKEEIIEDSLHMLVERTALHIPQLAARDFYHGRKEAIENAENLTEGEKNTAITFLKNNMVVISPSVSHGDPALLMDFKPSMFSAYKELLNHISCKVTGQDGKEIEYNDHVSKEKAERVCAEIGNYRFEQINLDYADEKMWKRLVKHGLYLINTFMDSTYREGFDALRNFYGREFDYEEIQRVITKVNEGSDGLNIPLTRFGFLDLNAVYEDQIPKEIYDLMNTTAQFSVMPDDA